MRWPGARPAATGPSTPATGTTAVCSTTSRRGTPMAGTSTPRGRTWPPGSSRSRSARRPTPHAAPRRGRPAASTCSTDEGPRCPPPLARSRRAPAAGPFLTGLLGPAAIRDLARQLELRPTKSLGQNCLHDANTIRRIVRTAELRPGDVVLEVGPGLGSLTLGLLSAAAHVTAVEIDPRLARLLPGTVAARLPERASRLTVVEADALRLPELPGPPPTALVANLPYNVAVPVLLTLLEQLPTLERALILVQAEVAERLAAAPGTAAYEVPSVKAAWYGAVRRAGPIGRRVFWPEPNVDSGLVSLVRHPPPPGDRAATFAVIDAAFATRRKSLRAGLARRAGSPAAAAARLRAAGIAPAPRGKQLSVADFARLAATSVPQDE